MSQMMTWATLILAALAAGTIIAWLVKKPVLSPLSRVWLLVGLGVLPIGASLTGNLQGFEASKKVEFCNGCHVMNPYIANARDGKADNLAAIHSRNPHFGDESCYTCHEDYGMFGTVTTKLGGMKHMYMYFTTYRNADPLDPKPEIKLYEPFQNSTCMQCHSTQAPGWSDVSDHEDNLEKIRAGKISCANGNCHGPSHPVKDAAKENREEASQ
jgi:cytochrome c-type protein NapC